MPDSKAIFVTLKYHALDYNISGVTLLFFKEEEDLALGLYSINITGEDMYAVDIAKPAAETFSMILEAKKKYDSIPTNEKKIHDHMMGSLHPSEIAEMKSKIATRDTGAVVFEMKKRICAAISSEDMKIQGEIGTLDMSQFLVFNAYERAETFTLSHKIDIAKKYCKDAQLAERIVKEKIADISIAFFHSPSCAAVILVENQKPGVAFSCASTDPETVSLISINTPDLDFFKTVSAKSGNDRGTDILRKSDLKVLVQPIISENESAANLLAELFAAGGLPTTFTCRFAKMNSVLLDIAYAPPFQNMTGDDKGEEGKHVRKTIDVNLMLAPTKGRRISELLPGNIVNVILDRTSPIGLKFIKNLNLLDENDRVKPIGAEIYGVKRDAKNGFTVYTKITHDLYGKSYEEQDVMVKAAEGSVDEVARGGMSPLFIGIVSGVIVIIIIVFIVVLLH